MGFVLTAFRIKIKVFFFFSFRNVPFQGLPQRIIVCDSHDDLALGFIPDALPAVTLTIYPGLGPTQG